MYLVSKCWKMYYLQLDVCMYPLYPIYLFSNVSCPLYYYRLLSRNMKWAKTTSKRYSARIRGRVKRHLFLKRSEKTFIPNDRVPFCFAPYTTPPAVANTYEYRIFNFFFFFYHKFKPCTVLNVNPSYPRVLLKYI